MLFIFVISTRLDLIFDNSEIYSVLFAHFVFPRNIPLKAVRTKATIKSSEEQELEKIKALREEVEKRRRVAQKSHKRAFSSSSHQPSRSVQPLTKVEEFSFATDKRIQDHKPPTGTATEHKKFTSMLRQYEPVKVRGATIEITIRPIGT